MPATILILVVAGIGMSGWPWNILGRTRVPDEHQIRVLRSAGNYLEWLSRAVDELADSGDKGAEKRYATEKTLRRIVDGLRGDGHPAFALDRSNRSAARYLMIGHAEYLGGNLPDAILSYRRGLRVAPTDNRLRDSIEFLRSQVEYPPDYRAALSKGPLISPRQLSDTLLCACCALYVAACLFGTFWLMSPQRSWARRSVFCFALAFVAGLGSFAAAERTQDEARVRIAVITEDGVAFRQGNGPSFPTHTEIPVLNRGMEARYLYPRGGWIQIELPTGQIGWVPREKVLVG